MAINPTSAQRKAVQNTLYSPARMQKLVVLEQRLAQLMNLDPTVELQENDIRNPPGSGPNWVYPATGGVDQNVLDAAAVCRQIAALLTEAQTQLAALNIPPAHKAFLSTSVSEEAAVWTARSDAWAAPGRPADAKATADQIAVHTLASITAAKKVARYLKTRDEVIT